MYSTRLFKPKKNIMFVWSKGSRKTIEESHKIINESDCKNKLFLCVLDTFRRSFGCLLVSFHVIQVFLWDTNRKLIQTIHRLTQIEKVLFIFTPFFLFLYKRQETWTKGKYLLRYVVIISFLSCMYLDPCLSLQHFLTHNES